VSTPYKDAPTSMIDVGGAKFAYRQLGADTGVPVIFLNHLGGVLDNWDPSTPTVDRDVRACWLLVAGAGAGLVAASPR